MGTAITLTATSTGCPNPQYLYYVQPPAGAWSIAREYGAVQTKPRSRSTARQKRSRSSVAQARSAS